MYSDGFKKKEKKGWGGGLHGPPYGHYGYIYI